MKITQFLLHLARIARSINHSGSAWKVPGVMVLDALAVVVALAFAFSVVQRSVLPLPLPNQNIKIYLLIPIFCHFSFRYFGLYQSLWRFASLPDYANILRSIATIALGLVAMNLLPFEVVRDIKVLIATPALIVFLLLLLVLVSSTRALARYLSDLGTRAMYQLANNVQDVMLAGGLDECEQFIKSTQDNPRAPIRSLSIISPRSSDVGRIVRGVPVVGTEAMLATALESTKRRFSPKRLPVLIILPGFVEAGDVATLMKEANQVGLRVRKPRSADSVDPLAGTSILEELSPEDILLRQSNSIDTEQMRALYAGKTVLVTGGGGSVGSSICQTLMKLDIGHLVVLDNSEYLMTELIAKLSVTAPDVKVTGRICDIRDTERTRELIATYEPWVVLHAAALKHVPVLETDWQEGFKTNYLATRNLVDCAIDNGVELFVFISTDKAVEPVSILGITKYCSELYVGLADRRAKNFRALSVRFGNVLASNGSVVPRFIQQAMRGGPVKITDPQMVRYFMTLEEASDLVLGASVHAHADPKAAYNRYILNIGQPLKIIDLAKRVIAAYSPTGHQGEVKLEIIGVRPGERFDEKLVDENELEHQLEIPGLSGLTGGELVGCSVEEFLADIEKVIASGDRKELEKILRRRNTAPPKKAGATGRPRGRNGATASVELGKP